MGVTPDLIRVLHVDDNTEVADLAASYLQQKHDGFDVEVVETVEAGLSRLRAEEFDCVVYVEHADQVRRHTHRYPDSSD